MKDGKDKDGRSPNKLQVEKQTSFYQQQEDTDLIEVIIIKGQIWKLEKVTYCFAALTSKTFSFFGGSSLTQIFSYWIFVSFGFFKRISRNYQNH